MANQEVANPYAEQAKEIRDAKEGQVREYGQSLIGASGEVHADQSGNLLLPSEQKNEVTHVGTHGHGSNETATKV